MMRKSPHLRHCVRRIPPHQPRYPENGHEHACERMEQAGGDRHAEEEPAQAAAVEESGLAKMVLARGVQRWRAGEPTGMPATKPAWW